jgi:hypothetical protein
MDLDVNVLNFFGGGCCIGGLWGGEGGRIKGGLMERMDRKRKIIGVEWNSW